MDQDSKRGGPDYHVFRTPGIDYRFCLTGCVVDVKCRAWTYDPPPTDGNPVCRLKTQDTAATSAPGYTSGLVHRESLSGNETAETETTDGPSPVAPAETSGFAPLEDGVAFAGSTLTYFPADSVAQCRAACSGNAQCRGFTFVKPGGYKAGDPPMCYLIAKIAGRPRHSCCVSAAKIGPPALNTPVIAQQRAAGLGGQCGTIAGITCAPDLECQLPQDIPDAAGVCVAPGQPPVIEEPTQGYRVEVGIDRPGMDFQSMDLAAADVLQCRLACDDRAMCRAFTYVRPGVQGPAARCWLKNGIPAPRPDECCTTGMKITD